MKHFFSLFVLVIALQSNPCLSLTKDSVSKIFQTNYWYYFSDSFQFHEMDTITFINRTECAYLKNLFPRICCLQFTILNKRKLKYNESSSAGHVSMQRQYLDNSNIFRYKIIKRKGVLFLRIVNSYQGMTKYKIIFLKHELCEREQPVRATYQWSLQLIKIPFD